MPAPQHDARLLAYELAHADHRAEVQLGWERQRFFLGLSAALLVAGSALQHRSAIAAVVLLALGAVLALVGALVVARSHGRTRRTRDALEARAVRLGLEGPEVTGGQRALHGKARSERFRVVTLVLAALAADGVLCACALIGLGARC